MDCGEILLPEVKAAVQKPNLCHKLVHNQFLKASFQGTAYQPAAKADRNSNSKGVHRGGMNTDVISFISSAI